MIPFLIMENTMSNFKTIKSVRVVRNNEHKTINPGEVFNFTKDESEQLLKHNAIEKSVVDVDTEKAKAEGKAEAKAEAELAAKLPADESDEAPADESDEVKLTPAQKRKAKAEEAKLAAKG
jgi:hypothetical protein